MTTTIGSQGKRAAVTDAVLDEMGYELAQRLSRLVERIPDRRGRLPGYQPPDPPAGTVRCRRCGRLAADHQAWWEECGA